MKYYVTKTTNIGGSERFGPVPSETEADDIIRMEMLNAQMIADINHKDIIISGNSIIYPNGLIVHYSTFSEAELVPTV